MSKKNIFLFIICVCIGGGISLGLGQDACFDLKNYHLYIPYAFLHGRESIDLLAAGPVHTFFNPLLDIPFFLLFSYLNNWPKLTSFVLGGSYGLLLFAFLKLTTQIIQGNTIALKCLKVAVVFFTLTGMSTSLQIGLSGNEITLALFAVLSTWLLFHGTDNQLRYQLKHIAGATFLVSCAAGLKYTAIPAAVGVGVCSIFLLLKNKASYKAYLYVIGAALVGFLLMDGYFLLHKWQTLGNPLFPFFNHIFKSPFFPPEALSNSPYVPNGWKERLLLPFLRISFPNLEYRLGFHILLGITSFILLCLGWVFYMKRRPLFKPYVLLLGLFIGTYIPWVILFANIRYAIFLEILSCLLFMFLLLRFIPAKYLSILLIALSLFSMARPRTSFPRNKFTSKNITFSQPVSIQDNSLVLVGGHISFLIPFLNPNARYIGGINFMNEKFHVTRKKIRFISPLQPLDYRHNFDIRGEIQKHSGTIYLLVPAASWIWNNEFWKEYGIDISTKYCKAFQTNFVRYPYLICTVNKSS